MNESISFIWLLSVLESVPSKPTGWIFVYHFRTDFSGSLWAILWCWRNRQGESHVWSLFLCQCVLGKRKQLQQQFCKCLRGKFINDLNVLIRDSLMVLVLVIKSSDRYLARNKWSSSIFALIANNGPRTEVNCMEYYSQVATEHQHKTADLYLNKIHECNIDSIVVECNFVSLSK